MQDTLDALEDADSKRQVLLVADALKLGGNILSKVNKSLNKLQPAPRHPPPGHTIEVLASYREGA